MAKEKWFSTCISNASIKCKSLRKKWKKILEKKTTRGHIDITSNTQTKVIVIWTIRNKMR